MHNVTIVFSNKGIFVEGNKEENVKNLVPLLLLFKEIAKGFVQCHVFAQTPPSRRPNDKYPVNTSHRSRFVQECSNHSNAW
jgi:hypothetical protein